MMAELVRLKEAVHPDEILLVADGMTGQDAVRIAQGFDEALGVTGVILTKMDGDARGGAALSIYGVTKKPIKYIGVGEKARTRWRSSTPSAWPGAFSRWATSSRSSRRRRTAFDDDEAKRLEKKVRKEGMDLTDFLTAMRQIAEARAARGHPQDAPGREHRRC